MTQRTWTHRSLFLVCLSHGIQRRPSGKLSLLVGNRAPKGEREVQKKKSEHIAIDRRMRMDNVTAVPMAYRLYRLNRQL